MKALIIADIQNDFLPGGALSVPRGSEIIPLVNRLQKPFELVVATQDWHPASHGSFASNHSGKKPFEKVMLGGVEQILWPDHCVQGSAGAEFAVTFSMDRIEAIFRKGTDPHIDSYSAFFDNAHKKSTGLGDYLKGKGIKQVYVSGLAAEYCVFYTILDALELGFETFLIQDGTRALDGKDFERALVSIKSRGGKVIESRELLK
jgi:nicotinamidase/pyrazinamidase